MIRNRKAYYSSQMRYLLAALLIAVTGEASAHDLWLEREDGGFALYYGHKHSDHGGADLRRVPVEWVREALCFDAAGARIPFQVRGDLPLPDAGRVRRRPRVDLQRLLDQDPLRNRERAQGRGADADQELALLRQRQADRPLDRRPWRGRSRGVWS